MEISGPRIGLRAMQLETVLAHVSQQLITCGRVRKHLTVRPEVGAVCEKDACPDLCGGREVTCVPTATAWHKRRIGNVMSWRRAHALAAVPISCASSMVSSRGHGATKCLCIFNHCARRLCPNLHTRSHWARAH